MKAIAARLRGVARNASGESGAVATFVPGLELARQFFDQAVHPVLASSFPGLEFSAARIGSGSEVLGYDTPRSADHEWGPRLQLFLRPDDLQAVGDQVRTTLSERLPKQFLGWSTHFGPEDAAIRRMQPTAGPVRHRVDVSSVAGWCADRLGFDAGAAVTTFDWLATPSQRLAETVGGAVFHDGLRELGPLRDRLAWYPDPVWRFLLACQWQRVAQEEAFPGRCAEVGDDVGCRVGTTRLVHHLMRLSLLMDCRYPPYGKWLGSALSTSPSGARLGAALLGALGAGGWSEREAHLAAAYRQVAARHNALELTEPQDEVTRHYYERPFQVIDAGRFVVALHATLGTTELDGLPLVGNVDQFIDNTDVLTDPRSTRSLAGVVFPGLARSRP
jgi:hypothetical protein